MDPTHLARRRDVGTIRRVRRATVGAHLRVLVKRAFRTYGYPPDKQEKATETMLEQPALLSVGWRP